MGDMQVGGAGAGSYVVPDKTEPAPTEPTLKGTIQCDGRGNLAVKNVAKPIDRFCVDRHENSHLQDWQNRYGPNVCNNVPAGRLPTGGPDYQEFLRKSECKAHQVGKECSEGKLKETDERLANAEDRVKNASGKKDLDAAKKDVAAATKDRNAYLSALDIDAVAMHLKYRCYDK
jgi:hypothetical protein